MSVLLKDVFLDGSTVDILVEGNRIARIGKGASADEVIDCRGKAALPGFVNTHTHAAMTLLRSYADDMPLQEWLQEKIWPLEKKLSPDDVYWGTKLACLEMIKGGTTCFNDMYFHMSKAAEAAQEMGMRAVLSEGFIDSMRPEVGEEQFRRSQEFVRRVREMNNTRILPALGPHALYTVSEESLRKLADFARKDDLLVHFHLSEAKEEVDNCIDAHGSRPVEYLDGIGFLSDQLLAAHSVWVSSDEIRLLSEKGVKISHNPVSNMKLAVGRAMPYAEMKQRNLNISLGTDGCASNNSLDMFETMKFAALLNKWSSNDQTMLPAEEAMNMATVNGAEALRIRAGRIAVGWLADIILIDLKRPEFTPNHNLASNVVYSGNASCVDTTIIDGKVVMNKRRVQGEEEILEKAQEVAMDLVSR